MRFLLRTGRLVAVGLVAALPLVAVGSGCGDGGGGGGGDGSAPTDPTDPTAPLPPPPSVRPDFVAEIVTWPSGFVPVTPGTEVGIDVTVKNVGAGDAPNRVAVRIPSAISALTSSALAAGEAETVTISFPAVSSNTTYTISATVDPEDLITEENESNNMSPPISFQTIP